MSAAHSRAQRNDFNVPLDSAGDRVWRNGAWRLAATHFRRRGKVRDCFAQMRMRCIWIRQGIGLNTDDFEQA